MSKIVLPVDISKNTCNNYKLTQFFASLQYKKELYIKKG